MDHHLFFAPPAGSDFFESDGPAFHHSNGAQVYHTSPSFQYPDHDVQEHCEDCCIDPKCLLSNCAQCSDHEQDCQQCLEECTDDCTKDKSFLVDCDGSNCSYFNSFASEPCTEPCQTQTQTPECTGCQTQLPLDLPLDPSFYQYHLDRPEPPQRAESSSLHSQLFSSYPVNGAVYHQAGPSSLDPPYDPSYAAATKFIPDCSSNPALNPYPSESWDQYGISNIQTPTHPSPTLSAPPPKRKKAKRPGPLDIPSNRNLRNIPIPPSPPTSSVTATTLDTATTLSTTLSTPTTPTSTTPKTYKCLWLDAALKPCNLVFPDPHALHAHLKAEHSVAEHRYCRWQTCHRGISMRAPFRFATNVVRHTWAHSLYRPYICPVCERGFAAQTVMAEHHASAHLKQKPFACPQCAHTCTSASNLKRHVAERHAHARFQCEWCARAGVTRMFRRGPNLARHFRKCRAALEACGEKVEGGKMGKMEVEVGEVEVEVDSEWFPPGYRKGKNGMDRAKVDPPNFMGLDCPLPPEMLEH